MGDISRKDKRLNHSINEESSNDNDAKKRKTERPDKKDEPADAENGLSSTVAAHYNSLKNSNMKERDFSKIIFLRNFNNFIKTLLIADSLEKLPDHSKFNIKVLDMCCGKGGDLIKWIKSNIRYIVCTDIAENSLLKCQERFNFFCEKFNKTKQDISSEFISADCTRVRLRSKYIDPSMKFDIVSCQFSFHYCFESLPQAECMLKNASECLKPGGFFIGTLPNAYEIIKRIKKSGTNHFGNSLFSLELCCSEPYPLFGAQYSFHLEEVVNCPEFLVHFPTFQALAEKFDLEFVEKKRFDQLFDEKKDTFLGRKLLRKMKALETYSVYDTSKLNGLDSDYDSAKKYIQNRNKQSGERITKVGTISKQEWEIITLYETFVFRKKHPKS